VQVIHKQIKSKYLIILSLSLSVIDGQSFSFTPQQAHIYVRNTIYIIIGFILIML